MSKMCRKTIREQYIQGCFSLVFTKTISILRNILSCYSKKFPMQFSVYSKLILKKQSMFSAHHQNGEKYANDTFQYYQDLDENLAWITQKNEEPKSNKGNFIFPINRANVMELESNKKVATPSHFYINPPFQSYSTVLEKNFIPPSNSIFVTSFCKVL